MDAASGQTSGAEAPATKTAVAVPRSKPQPAALRLEEFEGVAMNELAPIIGRSPREVKRFVNVYQILKAAIGAEELRGFVGTSRHHGDFRFPMSLLAIATGMPRAFGMLMHRISMAARGSDAANSSPTSDKTLQQIVQSAIAEMDSTAPRADLQRLGDFLSAHSEWAELRAAELAKWIGRVSQFTFEPATDRSHAV